jgi:hypothetical protein
MCSTYFSRVKVDEHMVVFVDRVCIRVRVTTAALKVFSTYEAAVDVDVREGDGAHLFKVEVEGGTIDLRAYLALRMEIETRGHTVSR